jgi:hypothetical protein
MYITHPPASHPPKVMVTAAMAIMGLDAKPHDDLRAATAISRGMQDGAAGLHRTSWSVPSHFVETGRAAILADLCASPGTAV